MRHRASVAAPCHRAHPVPRETEAQDHCPAPRLFAGILCPCRRAARVPLYRAHARAARQSGRHPSAPRSRCMGPVAGTREPEKSATHLGPSVSPLVYRSGPGLSARLPARAVSSGGISPPPRRDARCERSAARACVGGPSGLDLEASRSGRVCSALVELTRQSGGAKIGRADLSAFST